RGLSPLSIRLSRRQIRRFTRCKDVAPNPRSTSEDTRMKADTHVLGVNYRPLGPMDLGHHPSAVLLKNGEIVAMCEEERLVRIKEAPGRFPLQAIKFCLDRARISLGDLSAVGWNWSPELASARSSRQRPAVLRGVAAAAQFGL